VLNLLTLSYQHPDFWILFSEGHRILLKVSELALSLADQEHHWTTEHKPTHIHEHLDSLNAL
jgi:hypothetical protein